MRVLFLPDWRAGNNYQRLLAEALLEYDVEVVFPSGYRRGMPITRLCKEARVDLLHLHWPEAYWGGKWNYRTARFAWDLQHASSFCPIVYTAHNLMPHGEAELQTISTAYRMLLKKAKVIFTHSQKAEEKIREYFGERSLRFANISHGDLSMSTGQWVDRRIAATKLQLSDQPLCLMFGAVSPYKGIEEVIAYWRRQHTPAVLVVVGKPASEAYGALLREIAGNDPRIDLRLHWVGDEELAYWLSAANVAVFNYTRILTSGAAALARSWGVPILLPWRLETVDLAEPDTRVFRFRGLDEDFMAMLQKALQIGPDFSAAASWRESTRWSEVARITNHQYRQALSVSSDTEVVKES